MKSIKSCRDMCEPCSINSITQGSIFNNARNEDFGDKEDLGLLISARCDLANNKASKYSYLPTISLEKFIMSIVVKKLLLEQYKKEINQITQFILKDGGNPEAIKTYGMTEAAEKLITTPKNIAKCKEILEKVKIIEKLGNQDWKSIKKSDLNVISKKNLIKEVENLSENKTEGYYLIDNVIDHNDSAKELGPHVVMLREVHHMNSRVAQQLSLGCAHDEIDVDRSSFGSLVLEPNGFSYILCNTKSPYIELIMQRFASLFTRIGVQNPSSSLAHDYFQANMFEGSE